MRCWIERVTSLPCRGFFQTMCADCSQPASRPDPPVSATVGIVNASTRRTLHRSMARRAGITAVLEQTIHHDQLQHKTVQFEPFVTNFLIWREGISVTFRPLNGNYGGHFTLISSAPC